MRRTLEFLFVIALICSAPAACSRVSDASEAATAALIPSPTRSEEQKRLDGEYYLEATLEAHRNGPWPTTPARTPKPTATSTPSPVSIEGPKGFDGALLPSGPLVLAFDQPMQADLPGPAITLFPYVEGELTWNQQLDRLTFTPKSGFVPGGSYVVVINPDLKSARGEAYQGTGYLSIKVTAPPRVIRHSPTNPVLSARKPVIELQFDRPMDRESVAQALTMQPKAEYELSWKSADTVEIRVSHELDIGVGYRLGLGQGAQDEQGVPTTKAVFWEYGLPPVQVNVTGPSEEDRNRPITLGFGYALDPTSVMASMTITPSIDGTWTWSDAGSKATLELKQPLASDTTYTFGFRTPLKSSDGESLPALASVTFHSPSAILSVWPLEHWGEETDAIAIEFDREMNHQATESALRVEPPLDGHFVWEGNHMLFHVDGLPAGNTEYTVSLGPSAMDATGKQILNARYSWSFWTWDMQRVVRFGDWGDKIQVLDAEGERAIQFGLGANTPTLVQFELGRLTIAQLVELAKEDPSFRLPNAAMLDEPPEPVKVWDAVFPNSGTILKAPIPEDVPVGLYLASAKFNGQVQDQMVIVLTRQVLALKKAQNQLLAWVTEINGDAVPGIDVRVYDSKGSKIRQSQTDEDGLYETTLAAGEEPLLVVARTADGDVTVSGVGNAWSSDYDYYDWWGWGWGPSNTTASKSLFAYVYTDRPIYRPGQAVHYKAILRHDDDGVYRLPSTGTPVEVRVRDARDNVLQTSQYMTNAFGSIDGDFQLADKASLGDYALEVTVQGQAMKGRFKVQDYRKPDLDVTLRSDSENYVQGETIRLDVDSRYFFDQPVAGASLVLRRYELGQFYGWWWDEQVESEDPQYVWYQSYGAEIKGQTDAAGHYTAYLPAELGPEEYRRSDWGSSLEHSLVGIEATLDDGSHQTISTFTVVRVYNSHEKLTLETGSYLQAAGEPFNVDLHVSTISEEAVGGLKLGLQVLQWKRASRGYEAVGESVEVITDSEGHARHSLELATPGSYRLVVTGADSEGNPITFTQYLYVCEEDEWWNRNAFESREEGLSVVADRSLYRPYQTAMLTVESSFDGPALLTIERGKVRRERVIQLTAPVTRIEAPIVESDVPNIFVSVNAWQQQSLTFGPEDFLTKAESRLRRATVELKVDASTKNLDVTITPDRETYRPGEKAAVALNVTDPDGKPVLAEISLAVVDEAIFTLSEDSAKPILDAFYGWRRHTVRGYDSMAPTRTIWEPGRGGGGGDGGASPGNPRSDFQDTAAWFPHLRTDSSGRAAVTFDLPDDLTTWRLVAKAVTANTLVGEATARLVTQKEIVVRPLLPRSLTGGDRVDLVAVVHNYSDRRHVIAASMESEAFEFANTGNVSLVLEPGESKMITWKAVARQVGEAEVLVRADAEGIGDAVRLSLPVRPLAVPQVVTQTGVIENEWSTVLVMPEGALDISSVEIELNRSVAGSVLSGLEFLTGFPYGCVEQIMSKALPNAVVARAVRDFGISYPGASEDLSEKIGKGLQMLYAMQHDDGGWGWWYDDRSHDYQTAWVVFGLAKTAQAGYEVDDAVIDRGVKWLEENLASMDPRTKAFALYGMAEAGHGNLEAATALRSYEFELDGFSRAALALAFYEMGAEREARSMVDSLASYRVDTGRGVYWPTSEVDGYYNEKTMASSVRSTALILSAMTRIAPEDPAASEIARWLMGRRRDYGWGTTNETSFTVLALTDYLLYTQEAQAEPGFMVELNGELQAEGILSDEQPTFKLTIPAASMIRGLNSLRIVQRGEGRLYYVVSSRVYLPEESIEASGRIQVSRRYLDANEGTPLAQFEAGQMVKVVLEVNVPEDANYMLVEDNLPGGLEALNEALNVSGHVVDEEGNERYLWEDLGYNNKEVYGDRVSFFVTEMGEGNHVFSYFARAIRGGVFVALPTEVWAMYDLDLWGRSGSAELNIVATGTAAQ